MTWRTHFLPAAKRRLLLFHSAKELSPLCGRRNASWLPCLLWGIKMPFVFQYPCLSFARIIWYRFWIPMCMLTSENDLQFLFESTDDISVLPCGHTIHMNCLKEMQQHLQWVLYFFCFMVLILLLNHLCSTGRMSYFCLCYHNRYACPLCSKSVCDMSKVWEKLDVEIAATPMPESYHNKMVSLLFSLSDALTDCYKYSVFRSM